MAFDDPADDSAESSFDEPTDASLILCDWAEVINGKIYMMGAGWTRLAADQPIPIAVALLWYIPWDRANHRHHVELRLVNEDGHPVVGDDGNAIRVEGDVEVGRPPGVRPGSPLEAPLALKFGGLRLVPGRYRFEFLVDAAPQAMTAFEAVAPMV